MLMNSLRTSIIIASMLALLSCNNTDTNIAGISEPYYFNKVYFKFINNSNDNLSYERKYMGCRFLFNDNSTDYKGSPECFVANGINYSDPTDIYWKDYWKDYWKTDIPPVNVATIEPSDNATSYQEIGSANTLYHSHDNHLESFIATITIDNVTKKIVGFPKNLYRKLNPTEPEEFFDNIISYATYYGASFGNVPFNDLNYNRCGIASHTALTNYSKFSLNTRYYFDITVNSIDNITISLDKEKSMIGDSGYDNATNTCKFYFEEREISRKERIPLFPLGITAYNNIPDNLTGRIYIITTPDNILTIGYGAD